MEHIFFLYLEEAHHLWKLHENHVIAAKTSTKEGTMIYFAVFSFDSSIDGYLFRSLNPVLYDVNHILNHVKVKPFFIPIFLLGRSRPRLSRGPSGPAPLGWPFRSAPSAPRRFRKWRPRESWARLIFAWGYCGIQNKYSMSGIKKMEWII